MNSAAMARVSTEPKGSFFGPVDEHPLPELVSSSTHVSSAKSLRPRRSATGKAGSTEGAAGTTPHATCGKKRLSLVETERALLIQVRVALAGISGVRFWRNNVGVDLNRGVRYGLAVGSGDLIGHIDGRFASIELKTTKGRLSLQQERWLGLMRRERLLACVARSVDDVIAFVAGSRRA